MYVLQEFFNEVNMGHDHTPAAVPLAAELVKSISIPLVSISSSTTLEEYSHTHH